ncbi:hypothetical protein [Hyphococcus sp.]|uniref:hypothetical protein n=1 Tax=Hyphococcus sp. TaxID=2038636 RepID=UPI0035C6A92F
MRMLFVLIVSIVLLTGPAGAEDRRLSIALLTDFVPGKEFIAAEMVIEKTFSDGRPTGERYVGHRPATTGGVYAMERLDSGYWSARLWDASVDPDHENYLATVNLLNEKGERIAAGSLDVVVESGFTVTVPVLRNARAALALSLVGDRDGNRMLSYGDTARVTASGALALAGHAGRYKTKAVDNAFRYVDNFESGHILCAGSVKAPGGTVISGNRSGDETVSVRYSAAGQKDFQLQYDIIIAPGIAVQGAVMSKHGTAIGVSEMASKTDDIKTPALLDPTTAKTSIAKPADGECFYGFATLDDAATRGGATQVPDRRLGGPIEPVEPLDRKPPPAADRKICRNSIQDRIVWGPSGEKHWAEANLNRLCAGAENSLEPGRCFENIISNNVSRGDGSIWPWSEAVALCAGTLNHQTTVSCFQAQIRAGRSAATAIDMCKTR